MTKILIVFNRFLSFLKDERISKISSKISSSEFIDANSNRSLNLISSTLTSFERLSAEGKLLPMGAKGTDYYSENDEYCSPTSTNNMNGAGCTYKALNEPRYFLELK